MPARRNAADMLDREFLEIRCRLLDVAAALDRIERAEGADGVRTDRRLAQIAEALRLINQRRCDRAEGVQRVFSDPHDPDWRS